MRRSSGAKGVPSEAEAGMLFFFDTDDGERRIADHGGTELPDEAEAAEQAVSLLRDLSHAGVAPGARREFTVRVRRADGAAVYAASMLLTLDRLA